jgi:hypothetical protein
MAGSPQQLEWYIARDGSQHGPISDSEMRKFVELGHLRPADLVWCASFTEWVTGAQAFPEILGARSGDSSNPPVSSPPVSKPPASRPAQTQDNTRRAVQERSGAAAPSQVATRAEADRPVGPRAPGAGRDPRQGGFQGWPDPDAAGPSDRDVSRPTRQAGGTPATSRGEASHPGQHAAPTFDAGIGVDRGRHPGGQPHGGNAPSPDASGFGQLGAASGGFGPMARQPGFDGRRNGEADGDGPEGEISEDGRKPRRNGVGRLAGIVATVLIVSGLAWVGWQNRALLNGFSALGNVMMTRISSSESPESYRTSPYFAEGSTPEAVDAALQRTAIWRVLKRDYADWYGERVADIVRMRSEKQDEQKISKFMADVIVVLRRKNAQTALQSSPAHLKNMASSFIANLKSLATRDAQTCFGFISFGEATPFMLELSKTPTFAEPMQRQMLSIFEAISQARKDRVVHPSTRRTDYDVLSAELTARGWTQEDLTTFSNPKKLSGSPAEKVCRMVQDWFTAQLSLKDAELQSRLLAESLKPLVFG